MSRILLCIDDTDDISKKTSTGLIAEIIALRLENMGAEIIDGITRHQLLLDRNIDYTSHNSSMCIEAEGQFGCMEEVWQISREILMENMADTSNPGMALCLKDSLKQEQIKRVIDFGKRAKEKVLRLSEARSVSEYAGIRLEPLGGTGAGQIGSLAGIGLRLAGDDGTFRGKVTMDCPGQRLVCRDLKNILHIKQILALNGEVLPDNEMIQVKKQVKLSHMHAQKVLVVRKNQSDIWEACENADLYEKSRYIHQKREKCAFYMRDNDVEEQVDQMEDCYNCLYRRWTNTGIDCIREEESRT